MMTEDKRLHLKRAYLALGTTFTDYDFVNIPKKGNFSGLMLCADAEDLGLIQFERWEQEHLLPYIPLLPRESPIFLEKMMSDDIRGGLRKMYFLFGYKFWTITEFREVTGIQRDFFGELDEMDKSITQSTYLVDTEGYWIFGRKLTPQGVEYIFGEENDI